MRKSLTIAVLLSACIFSCKKNELPAAPGNTLSRIDGYSSDTIFASEFFIYDAQNRLIQYNTSQAKFELAYTAQGQLLTVTSKTYDVPYFINYTFHYTYDGNGRLIKKTTAPARINLSDDALYTYDASGRLIADSSYFAGNVQSYITYAYDDKNNVVGFEQFIKSGAAFTRQSVCTLTYDDKISPLHQVGKLLYYISAAPTHLSKGNLLGQTWNGTSSNLSLSYKYYSNGLLRTTVINGNSPLFNNAQRVEYTYIQP